ncbi:MULTISPECIES: ferritin-like domain-containing protein [Pseudothermotoga]|jgi:rubrerythrin|uniref:ferritin-like domain-containing protein n=1 Tax=Pseudothermotoga TaxID=1643951 RepID=UPI0003FC4020|nr:MULTISPECIES: ferritin family protein [Pseudothermotoga]KUK20980.1 MAG: Rubrerythrin [Pseudothermotoga lettingae]MDK2884205.1 hypothetical protein [Pseudothermotoga sp.]HBJ80700.1 rubrerythrin [Pseudothermotoga sp.]HBT26888.1 rubrerythrin [Pseudothermotoga sp.]
MNEQTKLVLKYALAREIEGRNFYKDWLSKLSNSQLKDIFKQLAEMEQAHAEYIESLLKDEIDAGLSFQGSQYFENRKLQEIGEKDEFLTDLSVLRMAYLIEHDFANFYESAAQKTDDLKMKDSLISLANWEKEHRDMLRELYDESMKQFWDDQGFVPLF